MALVKVTIDVNPAQALIHNIRAKDLFDWPTDTRRQLSATFTRVMSALHGRVRIDRKAADTIWRIGQTVSPYEPVILISRAQYILNNGGDIRDVRKRMKEALPYLMETWLVDAYVLIAAGKRGDALQSVRRGLAIPVQNDALRGRLKALEKELSR